MKQILAISALSVLKITLLPNLELLAIVVLCIGIDFATGILKAYVKKEIRTSSGFRKSILKFSQYGISILISLILTSVVKAKGVPWAAGMFDFISDGLLVFIIYIEATSIFENLYECDKDSHFSKYFIRPVLSILTFQLKNNPIFKAAENQQKTTEDGATQ